MDSNPTRTARSEASWQGCKATGQKIAPETRKIAPDARYNGSMARIEERVNKTGTSYKVVWYHKGKRQKPITVKSRREAEDWARLLDFHKGDQKLAGRDLAKLKSKRPALNQVAEDHFSRINTAPFTVQTYQSYMKNHIGPALGTAPIDTITDDDLRRFIKQLQDKKLAVKTIHNIIGPLAAVLDYAEGKGLISSSPYHASMLPKAGPVDDHDKFLTVGEAHKIINNTRNEKHADIHRLLLATGMRPAEMRALQVRDVLLEQKQPILRVNKAVKQDKEKGDYIGVPKSKNSVRPIGLPPSSVSMLRRHLADRDPEAPLFPGQDGSFLKADATNWHWNQAVKRTPGLTRKPSLYALRHTHASLMLANGMSIWKLSRHLGHGSVGITETTYSHLMPEAQYEAAQFASTFTSEIET